MKNIVIAGATRSGSTSLFNYLSAHPLVCGSIPKQTLFFLDKNYEFVNSKPSYHFSDGIKFYDKYFHSCKEQDYALEASPDYLYSEKSCLAIKSSLTDVRLIFILRNPIDRVKSIYEEGVRVGFINPLDSIESFANQALAERHRIYKELLSTGLYFKHLKRYLKEFERGEIKIVNLDDLSNQPKQTMKEICFWLKLDSEFYRNYDFVIANRAFRNKSNHLHLIYRSVRSVYLFAEKSMPCLVKKLDMIRSVIRRWYRSMNLVGIETSIIPQVLDHKLRNFYREDILKLEKLLGKDLNWIRDDK